MKRNNAVLIAVISLMMLAPTAHAYTNMSPEQVHARLAAGDTLQLLDVREVYEYEAGHIAEPAGQLPLTPANMPWSSDILEAEYNRLPLDCDILVYCRSGGRSAQASAFLESRGFDRIYNMTGGFSSWPYEKRDKGYGDHSGLWIEVSDTQKHTVQAPEIAVPPRLVGHRAGTLLHGPAVAGGSRPLQFMAPVDGGPGSRFLQVAGGGFLVVAGGRPVQLGIRFPAALVPALPAVVHVAGYATVFVCVDVVLELVVGGGALDVAPGHL